MRYCYGAADHQRDIEGIKKLRTCHTFANALFDVVSDTVVATQHDRRREAHQFFGAFVERAVLEGLRVEREEALNPQMVAAQQPFVHFRPVAIEFIHRESLSPVSLEFYPALTNVTSKSATYRNDEV